MRKIFKFRLPTFNSKKYMDYTKAKHPDKDRHHIIGKFNDYLIIPLTRAEHNARHSRPDKFFEEDLLKSIHNLMEYVKYLEQK